MKQHLHKHMQIEEANTLESSSKGLPICNFAQKAAITHESGPVLCLAGPGSGKTFTLTHHIRHLILEAHIEPSQILVITFSKAAAIEMQQRFMALMEEQYYPVRFGTFHAVFFQILSRYEGYTAKDILTNSRKKQLLKTVFMQMDYQGKEDTDTMEHILQEISFVKNCGGLNCMKRKVEQEKEQDYLSKIQFDIPQFLEIYNLYDKLLRQEHVLDFDDMALLCYQLFMDKPYVLEEYRNEINYVLVDEYQDINMIQYDLIKMLVEKHQNLFAVGDDDQSIYGFRGSNPAIMLRFKQDFPNGKIIPFEVNYRSSKEIVTCAEMVICENKNRYAKKIQAYKNGNGVIFHPYSSKMEEYEDLLNKLRKAKKEGILEQCVCLFRTNMDASYLAELLLKEQIPYCMRERAYDPYDNFICRDILHYLHLKEGNLSIHEFVPVMNRPLRYLGRNALQGARVDFEQLLNYYKDKDYMQLNIKKLQYDLERMKNMDLYASVNYIRKAVGYDEYLIKQEMEKNQPVGTYIKMADEIQKRFGLFETIAELEQHIEHYRVHNLQSKQKTENGISLMTYHASKGLEFDTVFLPDCNEGIIPHKKSVLPLQIEEERRLFYVAMTRAKEQLHILFVEGNKEEKHMISRFLKRVYREKSH